MSTPFLQTVDLLQRAGLPIRSIDLSTVQYWLMKGWEPARIAIEIFSVPASIATERVH